MIILALRTIWRRDRRNLSLLRVVIAVGRIPAVYMVSTWFVTNGYDPIIEVKQSFGSKFGRIIAVAFTDELVFIQGGGYLLQCWSISAMADDILKEDQRLVGRI